MPRPARRLQLLGAARDVFVAQGYHAAAMDEIAERAGVSKPVLYQHFPGKLELYLALLDESVDELIKAVSEALSSTNDNRQRVPATFKAFYDYVAGAGEEFRLVFESDLSNEPAVRDRLDRAMHECADMVAQFIREDAGVSDRGSASAGGGPGRHGPGDRAVLAHHRPGHSQGRGRAPDRQARLARDQRLAEDQLTSAAAALSLAA